MTVYIKVLALIALLFGAITFGVQNSESVPLRYYFGVASAPLPIYLVMYGAIILGVVAGMAFGVYSRMAMKAKLRRLCKEEFSFICLVRFMTAHAHACCYRGMIMGILEVRPVMAHKTLIRHSLYKQFPGI